MATHPRDMGVRRDCRGDLMCILVWVRAVWHGSHPPVSVTRIEDLRTLCCILAGCAAFSCRLVCKCLEEVSPCWPMTSFPLFSHNAVAAEGGHFPSGSAGPTVKASAQAGVQLGPTLPLPSPTPNSCLWGNQPYHSPDGELRCW